MKLVLHPQPSTETSQTRIHGKSQSLAQCLSRASEAHQREVSDKVGSATGSLDTEHRHAILRTLVHHLDCAFPSFYAHADRGDLARLHPTQPALPVGDSSFPDKFFESSPGLSFTPELAVLARVDLPRRNRDIYQ